MLQGSERAFGRWMRGALGVSTRTPPSADEVQKAEHSPQEDRIHHARDIQLQQLRGYKVCAIITFS